MYQLFFSLLQQNTWLKQVFEERKWRSTFVKGSYKEPSNYDLATSPVNMREKPWTFLVYLQVHLHMSSGAFRVHRYTEHWVQLMSTNDKQDAHRNYLSATSRACTIQVTWTDDSGAGIHAKPRSFRNTLWIQLVAESIHCASNSQFCRTTPILFPPVTEPFPHQHPC